jgi:hypothetical protein
MATLDVVLTAFASLQENRFKPNISAMTTASGRTTISAMDFLSFGGITDEDLLKFYVKFIKRDKLAHSFRVLLNLEWGTSPAGIKCKLSFDLSVPNAEVQRLRMRPDVAILTPQTAIIVRDQLNQSSGIEIDSMIISDTPVNEGDVGLANNDIHFELPDVIEDCPAAPSKRRRSKKNVYSIKTLSKYAIELEHDIVKLIESSELSDKKNLQNQVLSDVLRRLGNRVGSNETLDISHRIVTNIKDLVTDMRDLGANDIEQIRFLEGLALAVSGDLSVAKIVSATGLSKRSLEHGRNSRKAFNDESIKARNEEILTNNS